MSKPNHLFQHVRHVVLILAVLFIMILLSLGFLQVISEQLKESLQRSQYATLNIFKHGNVELTSESTRVYISVKDEASNGQHVEVTPQKAKTALYDPNIIRIAMVSAQWDREPIVERETELSLKSILMHTHCPIHFNFITTDLERSKIRNMLKNVQSPRHNVTYTFVPMDEENVMKKAKTWGVPVSHHAGVPGFAKFLIPDMLPWENRILMLDTDILVGADLCELWRQFRFFDERNKSTQPEEEYTASTETKSESSEILFAFPSIPGNGFCSCVGLMDLQRMRNVDWTGKYPLKAFDAWYKKHGLVFPHGDQSMFVAVAEYEALHNAPGIYREISHSWNIDRCSRHYYGVLHKEMTTDIPYDKQQSAALSEKEILGTKPSLYLNPETETEETFWGIVHFNCMINDKNANPRPVAFGPWEVVYEYILNFRWEWINEGRTTKRIFEIGAKDGEIVA